MKNWSTMFRELHNAEDDYKMAFSNFNNAERDYIEEAIFQLNEALNKYNSVRAEHRMQPIEI